MKKRFFCVLLVLTMMLNLIPGMVFSASAADEFSEVIAFNESTTAESEHFTLTTAEVFSGGWCAQSGRSTIVIEAKSDNFVITAIDAFVSVYGSNYSDATYSSGEKVETGEVANDSTVHVKNINANLLEINSKSTLCIALKGIKVYYTHIHDFTGPARDNGDGTHSFKCTLCDEYGNTGNHALSEATCTRPGLCMECHLYVGKSLGHDFPETWQQYNAEQHVRTCERCKEEAYEDHTWSDYICTACGEENVTGAKADATNEVIKAIAGGSYAIAQKAFYDIGAADTVADVIKIKNQALADMAAAELAAAKVAAKEAIAAEQGNDTAENVVKAAEDAVAAIEAATAIDDANAAKDEGIKAIQAAKDANKHSETHYTLTFNVNGVSVMSLTGVSGQVIDLGKYVPTKDGYTFAGWCSDKALTVSVTEVKFTGDMTVYAKWIKNSHPALPFTDVAPSSWSYDSIYFVWGRGLMNGISETLFAPNLTTSRAMIVTILWRLEGGPVVSYAMSFDDVKDGQWYTEAIRWAQANGIVNGYSAGKFGVNDPITREQMAAILYRYAQFKGYDVSVDENTNFSGYNDFRDVSKYAKSAMMWAIQNKLIQGDKQNLMPQGNATREQVAAILQRYCVGIVK